MPGMDIGAAAAIGLINARSIGERVGAAILEILPEVFSLLSGMR